MSECRALTNLVGNGVATVVISRWVLRPRTDGYAQSAYRQKFLNLSGASSV